jgi:hypothetical protein
MERWAQCPNQQHDCPPSAASSFRNLHKRQHTLQSPISHLRTVQLPVLRVCLKGQSYEVCHCCPPIKNNHLHYRQVEVINPQSFVPGVLLLVLAEVDLRKN